MTRPPQSAPLLPALALRRALLSRCVRCGACRAVCPSFLLDHRESLSARGRMAMVDAVLAGNLSLSSVFRDRLATCTGCMACEAACASGVPVTEIIQAAREEAVAESGPGLIAGAVAAALKHPSALNALAWLAPLVLRAGRAAVLTGPAQGRKVRGARAAGPRRRGRLLFFPGCAVTALQHDVGRAAVAVLAACGYDVVVPDGLVCCGRPLLSLGDRKAAEELMARNRAVIAATAADAVVTACASCGLTFQREYHKLQTSSGPESGRILDIHEVLAGSLSDLELDSAGLRITWHDPCHLGRGQGLAGRSRAVLKALPGIELVEMEDPDRCCGFGGVMRATHPEASQAMGRAKARNVAATGADAVVTGCPACRMQIADALIRAGSRIEALHTVQVIEKALKRRNM